MTRGRPKGSKNKPKSNILMPTNIPDNSNSKSVNLFDTKSQKVESDTNVEEVTVEVNEVVPKDSYKYKVQAVCDLCKSDIYISPVFVNFTHLSGVAYWHRKCVDRVCMCQDCARKFSEQMDSWLISNGAPIKHWHSSEPTEEIWR